MAFGYPRRVPETRGRVPFIPARDPQSGPGVVAGPRNFPKKLQDPGTAWRYPSPSPIFLGGGGRPRVKDIQLARQPYPINSHPQPSTMPPTRKRKKPNSPHPSTPSSSQVQSQSRNRTSTQDNQQPHCRTSTQEHQTEAEENAPPNSSSGTNNTPSPTDQEELRELPSDIVFLSYCCSVTEFISI
ncbi:hypothetical protein H4Q26_016757 [Puccinia striiformis f. sp. tritici PST-130]|nr:hypothetical protein H4Q26_016757 [Puccinia striiformis f. sp. tritici PST-130]